MDKSEFVKKHLELLNIEKVEEVEEQKTFLETLSLTTLQRKGLCLSKIKIGSYKTGMYGRCIVKFEAQWMGNTLPSNSFSSGDIAGVWASSSDGCREVIASGVLTSCSSMSVHVAFEKPFELLDLDAGAMYSLVKLSNDVTYRRMKKALESLERYENGPSYSMINVIFGNSKPRQIQLGENYEETFKSVNETLNGPQKEAIKLAMTQKEVAIIHGPPGTGKTTTVVEIILLLAKKGCKILVCAPSNIAVDNLLEKLGNYKIKLIRLGHPARVLPTTQKFSLDYIISRCDDSQVITELRQEIDQLGAKQSKKNKGEKTYRYRDERQRLTKELKEREKKVMASILKNADVILSTLVGASDEGPLKNLPPEHFDLVVIDECSQALEAACWIPLLKAPKCLLAGDHLQLPPTIFSKTAAEQGLEVSLMERLVKMDTSIVKLLEIQYRMHQDIMKLSSSTLYDDKLVADKSVANHLLKDLPGVEDNEVTSVPLFLIDTTGCDMRELEVDEEDSKGNEGEADLVSIHVENLIKSGVNPKDIAVIAPYNLQVELIRCRLIDKYPTLEIRSVDGFQGREKEVVVLTLVRSNDKGEVGFLAEDRRINVAITRAKRHLAVICDSETVSHHPFLKSLVDYLNSRGEVQSANQYSFELDNVEIARPDHLKFKKSSQLQGKLKTKTPKVEKNPSGSGNKIEKSFKNTINKGKPDGVTNLSKEEQNQIDERRRIEYEKTILNFISNQNETKLEFSTNFTSFDRLLVHEIAEKLQLIHVSEGEGDKRRIVLYKKVNSVKPLQPENAVKPLQPENAVKPLQPENSIKPLQPENSIKPLQPENSIKPLQLGSKEPLEIPVQFIQESRNTEKVLKQPTTMTAINIPPKQEGKQCPHCSKIVPNNNYTLHTNHCQKISKPPKLSKSKKNILESKNDDADSILDNIVKSKDVCAFLKCKTSVTLLGQICQFCKEQFCLSHHMAEIHGCGDEAKAHARSSIRKEMASCHKEAPKKLDAVKRVHVQRKLDKKLEELANQRKGKKKDK